MDADPNPRRRFLRFSLRAMLLLVLVFAIVLGWALHEVREQGTAVAALRTIGCEINFSEGDSLTSLERLRTWFGENEPMDVTQVLAWGQMTDVEIGLLQEFPRLDELYLFDTQVTDAGLAKLNGLTELTYLCLEGTQITDAGLVQLRGLTKLEKLDLSKTLVTDAGVAELQKALPACTIAR